MPESPTIDIGTGARSAMTAKTRRRLVHSVPIERHHLMESVERRAETKPSLAWRLLQSFASRTDQD